MEKFRSLFIIMAITILAGIIIPTNVFAYTLSFDANGGSGTMDSIEATGSTSLTNENTFTAPTGKVFVGWSFIKEAKKENLIRNSFNMDEDKTVYAVWFTPIKEASATITVPVGGQLPDVSPISGNSTLYSVGGPRYLNSADWYTTYSSTTEFNKNAQFIAGENYTVHIGFRPEEGYCFTENTIFKINGQVAENYGTTGGSVFIRGAKYEFTALDTSKKVNANITINDYSTINRGKFSLASDANSDKTEFTSSLSANLIKGSNAILYVTPENDYSIDKIVVDGSEVSFEKDLSLSGVNKPYKVIVNMDSNKNIIIYFKLKKVINYNLSAIKKNSDEKKIDKNVNKEQFINQMKTNFINELNAFKTDKTNVTSLSDDYITSLFTDNKYAVITSIKYKDSSYKSSSDLIAIGELTDWKNMEVVQGWIEVTNKYEVEYTEFILVDNDTYTYKFIDGDYQEFIKGKLDGYTFKIDGDYDKFESLKIGDLSLIKDTDYIATKGSTIITLTVSGINKLNKLNVGTYSVETKFTDNIVTGKLVIKNEVKQEENPKTGDNIISSIILGSISLANLIYYVIYINKKKIFNL